MNAHSATRLARLALIADVLIPAGADMPSASDVDVHGAGIARVLRERPDLESAVALAASADVTDAAHASAWVHDLRERDEAAFDRLLETVAGAYFLDPGVAAAIGYRNREAIPIVFDTDLDALTAPVTARGPIYRTAS